MSPGHPHHCYPNNVDFSWLIEVPHGKLINITFLTFDLEPDCKLVFCFIKVAPYLFVDKKLLSNKYSQVDFGVSVTA